MANPRIYELAKKYKITSERMLSLLEEAGFSVKSHMSAATEDMVKAVEKKLAARKRPAKGKDAGSKKATVKKEKPQERARAAVSRKKEKEAPRIARKAKLADKEKKDRKTEKRQRPKAGEAKPSRSEPSRVIPPRTKTPRYDIKKSSIPAAPPAKKPPRQPKARISAIEKQQKAVRESVRRTLARLEVARKTKRRKEKHKEVEPVRSKPGKLAEQVAVKELASVFGVDAAEILQKCLELGTPATINQKLERDVVELLAEAFAKEIEFESDLDEPLLKVEESVDPSKLKPRAPIVTVMGHVDHGKTSILDFIRRTNVAGGEAGGITQQIGAYVIESSHGRITFIDTPGHEAFTSMRARGASVTDVVVLVIAADDGVMPQTLEAISHAQAAGVPLVIAINKMDLPNAAPDRVKQQLAEKDIVVEAFGGDVVCQEVSAKTGDGIDKLLELIILQADLLELKAREEGPANGVVIEVKKEEGRGIQSTFLIKEGTLKVGDVFVAGIQYGKVRALLDHVGRSVTSAGPSVPVLVLGCNGLPSAGENFVAVPSEKEAREISLRRREAQRNRDLRSGKKLTLEELYTQIQEGAVKELRLVIKGDTNGSVEALGDNLSELSTDEVRVDIIHSGVGFITESDVLLAASSNAMIVGFSVKASPKAEELAEKEKVEIRHYDIIYECISEIKDAIEGMLEPEMVENILGRAEVRKIFKISRLGTIAGSMVLEGTISRNALARVIRDGEQIIDSKISSLKRFQEDVKDVQRDFECGIGIAGFNDVQEGDIIETYVIKQKSKITL